jgi:hypothetical protein
LIQSAGVLSLAMGAAEKADARAAPEIRITRHPEV